MEAPDPVYKVKSRLLTERKAKFETLSYPAACAKMGELRRAGDREAKVITIQGAR